MGYSVSHRAIVIDGMRYAYIRKVVNSNNKCINYSVVKLYYTYKYSVMDFV